jgi:hypothetical protein
VGAVDGLGVGVGATTVGGVACGVGVGTTGATGWTVLPPQAAARRAAPNETDLKRRLMLTSFRTTKNA